MNIPRASFFALILAALTVAEASAQNSVRLSGLAYIDYAYVLDDPSGDSEGDNGFGYRRLYLTGDYAMSDDVSFRARLEANDGGTNSAGRPSPFVKDMYVRWKNVFADGHELFIGISPTPIWSVSESFLGYRSLEATLLDYWDIASSRDMGAKVQGPITESGSVRYAVMLGNNSSVKRETDRHKRLYGQLEFHPTDRLSVTIGGDYASMDDGSAVTANAFAGYRLERVRFGVEAFVSPVRTDGPTGDTDRSGVSVFAAAEASTTIELVFRYDYYSTGVDDSDIDGSFGLAGAAISVADGFRIIPNLVYDRGVGDDDALLTGRMTVEAHF